jgi:hypothetical protein
VPAAAKKKRKTSATYQQRASDLGYGGSVSLEDEVRRGVGEVAWAFDVVESAEWSVGGVLDAPVEGGIHMP